MRCASTKQVWLLTVKITSRIHIFELDTFVESELRWCDQLAGRFFDDFAHLRWKSSNFVGIFCSNERIDGTERS